MVFLHPIFVVFQHIEFISKIILKSISVLHTPYCNRCCNNRECKNKHFNYSTILCNNNNNNNEDTYYKTDTNTKYFKNRYKPKLGLKDVPGPLNLPFIGSSWLYTWFGPYTHKKYHESNDDKFFRYGPVVREKILFNTIIHLFAKDDINKVLNHK